MTTISILSKLSRTLKYYFFLTYCLVLIIVGQTVSFKVAFADGIWSTLFVSAALLCYGVLYLVPAILLTWLCYSICRLGKKSDHLNTQNSRRIYPTYLVAILTAGLTTLLLHANAKIFELYGTYINGFIINLVRTPGGLSSLGGSGASDLGFALIAIGFLALQAILLWLAIRLGRQFIIQGIRGFNNISTMVCFIIALIGLHFGYAAGDAYNKIQLVSVASSVPFFQPVTSKHFFKKLGVKVDQSAKLDVKGRLNYPLNPLKYQKPEKPLNIVWLTAESWRADTLDSKIMPATWQFAATANRFTHNFSGGNGTRMGVFSMFTGLPGNYWFSFLDEQRGAALIDVLKAQDYQIHIYTSALFSYPEFDKTIFSRLSAQQMQGLQNTGKPGWERDRQNVSDMLNFIDKRDQSKPFFTFMFFESPHARYFFPPESVIATPYEEDINYATIDKSELRKDIVKIKNRYINSVHHLDSQFARVIQYLTEKNLLDSTIIIMVGDHGEEFMEHGYWGHNSTFVDQQIRTPLVFWVPGKPAQVNDKMTSHMDIVPSIMPLLGVTNPASDYAIGYDLLGKELRARTYSSDWSRITYIDSQVKITEPVSMQGFAGTTITDANDLPLPSQGDTTLLDKKKQQVMLQTFNDLHMFLAKKNKAQN
jgi:uncharacterized protein